MCIFNIIFLSALCVTLLQYICVFNNLCLNKGTIKYYVLLVVIVLWYIVIDCQQIAAVECLITVDMSEIYLLFLFEF